MKREIHEIEPVFNKDSKILILGSFPSVKSREGNFFYHHPRNRFWKVVAGVCGCDVPVTVEEKKAMLLEHGIAVWDVISSCDIEGSSDSSIKNVVPNDLTRILEEADIERIYTNGAAANRLYRKYCYGKTNIADVKLPSTSPANAGVSMEQLLEHWRVLSEK